MSAPVKIVPVILCGGSGSRLWPLSREGFPKQFLSFYGNQSLFQKAFIRLQSLNSSSINIDENLIVTNEEQRFLALDQLLELKTQMSIQGSIRFVLEPQGKNTAPALTVAALDALKKRQDPILVVAPSDQIIEDQDELKRVLTDAIHVATEGAIVVLGVTPTKPETGYGYIQVSKELNHAAYAVLRFTEKPNIETAKKFFNQGSYYWNSGMFVMKASLWLKALYYFRPDIAHAVESAWEKHEVDELSEIKFVRPNREFFSKIPSESIDYAVIEKCPQSVFPIKMLPLNAGWNDLGAWDAVWQTVKQDSEGNAAIGDVLIIKSKNSLVIANNRLVSVVGVSDLIIIETADAVLVANKNLSQDVKIIVSKLEQDKREEKNLHRKVYRPWGWYDSVDEGERFKVKRIHVKPTASLSLQMHNHRAEHWIVVKGIAEIISGEQTIILNENQSIYIPQGQLHRLKNCGETPLEIIEVQTGSYLAEDDILRFNDLYGRDQKK